MTRPFLIMLAVMFGLLASQVILPSPAHAQVMVPELENCENVKVPKPPKNNSKFEVGLCAGGGFQDWQFTSKLVECIERTIRSAVMDMMTVIYNEFSWLVSVMGTLVIIFHGIRVALGERELLKRTMILVLKIAFVIGFMNMLPDIVNWVFGILKDMLRMVTGGISPWLRIDIFLGKLFGFGPTIVLLNGLVGLVGAVTFSSKVGFALFFFGVLGVMNLLTFILRVIYTYCLAFLTIGFLLTLTPIVLPIALFSQTERYFRKWCDIIVSAILTPMLLFAFMWMFMGIFDILIQNIFTILGGNDFKAYWRMNTSMFSWLMPGDPNANLLMQNVDKQGDLPCIDRTIRPPVQEFANPLLRGASEVGSVRTATLNFGANEVSYIQQLSVAFLTLWLFASLMKSMLELIPKVASSIASVSSHITFGGGSQMIAKLQGGLNKAQAKVQAGAAEDIENGAGKFAQQMQNMLGNRNR